MLSVVVPSIIALTELLINEAQLYPPHPTMKKDAMGRTSEQTNRFRRSEAVG